MPTKINVHASHTNPYLHEYFEPILLNFLNPMDYIKMAQKGNSAKFENKLYLYYTYSLSIFLYNSEDYDEFM